MTGGAGGVRRSRGGGRKRGIGLPPWVFAAMTLLAWNALGQERIISPSSVGEVDFPHLMHVEELGFDCTDCHHETHASRLSIPHEDYFDDFWIDCRACHQGADSPLAPQACSACHESPPTAHSDETLSAKVVIHQSCWECHESGTGQDASRSCAFCHRRPRPQP